MTAEKPNPAGGQIPPPPDGFPTWLDYVLDGWDEAKAELAALRQALADRSADLAVCLNDLESVAKERDGALKKLSDTEGWLATARQQALDLDAMRAEAVRERDTLKMLREKGCDCSDEEACRFVRERDEARAKLAELTAAVHAAATQLEVAEQKKEDDLPLKAESHFREAVRTIARTLPPATVQHDRGAVWGELREMDRLHVENLALEKKLAELRTIALRLGKLETLAARTDIDEALVSDVPFIPAADLEAHNAIVDELRAEQGGEGKS